MTLISFVSLLSALSGVNKGIKLLSYLNIATTLFLLFFVFIQSDIIVIIKQFFLSLFHYILDFIPMSLVMRSYDSGKVFLTDWTYYYWAFWLAWAPFTRILFIPSLGTFLWFTVFEQSAFGLIKNWGSACLPIKETLLLLKPIEYFEVLLYPL